MTGRQFIARVRRWARVRDPGVRFVASEGPGSHGTLYAGGRKTIVKDRRKEIGKGLLADLGIDRDELQEDRCPTATTYPADIERDEDGRHVVSFPDFGWGATDGATRDEPLAETRDLLRELIAATMREGGALPEPSPAGRQRPLWWSRRCRPRSRRRSTRGGAMPGYRNAGSPATSTSRRARSGAC